MPAVAAGPAGGGWVAGAGPLVPGAAPIGAPHLAQNRPSTGDPQLAQNGIVSPSGCLTVSKLRRTRNRFRVGAVALGSPRKGKRFIRRLSIAHFDAAS